MNLNIAWLLAGFMGGFLLLGLVFHRKKLARVRSQAKEEQENLIQTAKHEADQLLNTALQEAKEESRRKRRQFEQDAKKKRQEYQTLEKKTQQRKQALDDRADDLMKRELTLEKREQTLLLEEKKYQKKAAHLDEKMEDHQRTLERVAHMSAEEAKQTLMSSIEEQARQEAKKRVADIEADMHRKAQEKAQHILALAVQRDASEFVSDIMVSVVSLPSEEMKGRIIGREGRNIRAIEQATGVDIIIDDTPEAVILSCFNPVRRQIAKITLERLMEDGRIHPARIEETAKRVTQEFDQILKDYGEQAALDVGVADVHPDLLGYLGHLRFKVFGKRSVLQHAVETAHIAGNLASEMGISIKLAKRAGLLHELGQAVDQEAEGSHTSLGAKLCERYGESKKLTEAIKHHRDENLAEASVLTVCLSAANSVSEARLTGPRDQQMAHIKRLEDMEQLVQGFPGVEKAMVFQAGREVRVMVNPDVVADENMKELSQDIAARMRSELTFPGRVKVTLLRESKFVDFAQ